MTEPVVSSPSSTPTAVRATPTRTGGCTLADPMPVALGLFAFALAIYGVRFFAVTPDTLASGPGAQALNYALLVAAAAEVICGVLGIIRGMDYSAYIVCMFGIWLLFLYFLVTVGAAQEDFTPWDLGWYALMLNVTVIIMAVPAFVHRHVPFMITFVSIIALLFLMGLGYINVFETEVAAKSAGIEPDFSTAVNMIRISSYFAFLGAAAIWWAFGDEVYRITGVLRTRGKVEKNPAGTPPV